MRVGDRLVRDDEESSHVSLPPTQISRGNWRGRTPAASAAVAPIDDNRHAGQEAVVGDAELAEPVFPGDLGEAISTVISGVSRDVVRMSDRSSLS